MMLVLRLNDNLAVFTCDHFVSTERKPISASAADSETPASVRLAGEMETAVRELPDGLSKPRGPVAFRGQPRELGNLPFR